MMIIQLYDLDYKTNIINVIAMKIFPESKFEIYSF